MHAMLKESFLMIFSPLMSENVLYEKKYDRRPAIIELRKQWIRFFFFSYIFNSYEYLNIFNSLNTSH